VLNFFEAVAQDKPREHQAANENGKSHRWAVKFFCEAKAADIAPMRNAAIREQ